MQCLISRLIRSNQRGLLYVVTISFLAVTLTAPVRADVTGKVVRVLDGDTIDVLTETHRKIRVRLDGIDAPEKSQPYGQRSRQQLTTLIAHNTVNVAGKRRDRYGRVLGTVTAINAAASANEQMVTRGMAWAYRYHGKPTNEHYAALEHEARINRTGLWRDANPTEPYKWRKQHKR